MRLCRRMPSVVPVVLSDAISRHIIPSVVMGLRSDKCLSGFLKNNIQVRIGFGHGVSSVSCGCISAYYWIKERILLGLLPLYWTSLSYSWGLWVHPNYLGVKNPSFSGMNPKYNIIPLGYSCGMVYWLLSTYQLGFTSKHVTHPPYFFFATHRPELSAASMVTVLQRLWKIKQSLGKFTLYNEI